jgi:hypothetical protein
MTDTLARGDIVSLHAPLSMCGPPAASLGISEGAALPQPATVLPWVFVGIGAGISLLALGSKIVEQVLLRYDPPWLALPMW